MPRWWKASCRRPVVVKRLEAPHDMLLTIRVYAIALCIYISLFCTAINNFSIIYVLYKFKWFLHLVYS